MQTFSYRNNQAYCEDIGLLTLAQNVKTPFYVYSQTKIERQCQQIARSFGEFPVKICFAVKANSNPEILKTIFRQGFGADIVSSGELRRSLECGVPADKIVFSGVGKTEEEIRAALLADIFCFNVESESELELLSRTASALKKTVRFSLRINPDVLAGAHHKIATGHAATKFGVDAELALHLAKKFLSHPYFDFLGLSVHIGSQILDLSPFANMAAEVDSLCSKFLREGVNIKTLNFGGGLGVPYTSSDSPIDLKKYAEILLSVAKKHAITQIIIEPGRYIVGEAGLLVTKIIRHKKTHETQFVIVDASMTELIRPAMYDSYHEIRPVVVGSGQPQIYDIVGPVCETSDTLGKRRSLTSPNEGDLLFIETCGAYGYAMASQYNLRPLPPEVLIHGSHIKLIN